MKKVVIAAAVVAFIAAAFFYVKHETEEAYSRGYEDGASLKLLRIVKNLKIKEVYFKRVTMVIQNKNVEHCLFIQGANIQGEKGTVSNNTIWTFKYKDNRAPITVSDDHETQFR